MSVLLQSARNVGTRLERQLYDALIEERADIADAVAVHGSVVEHYWQKRHRLQREYEAVRAIIEVLELEP